jgi:hypothetical protein
MYPGDGVVMTRDFTLMSVRDGVVAFYKMGGKQYVRVDAPAEEAVKKAPARKAPAKKAEPKTEEAPVAAA